MSFRLIGPTIPLASLRSVRRQKSIQKTHKTIYSAFAFHFDVFFAHKIVNTLMFISIECQTECSQKTH